MKNYTKAQYLIEDMPVGRVTIQTLVTWLVKVAVYLLTEKMKECNTGK
jgi:hypothetical protein